MSEDGTITPEVKIKDLEERLEEETDRLLKLYAAYEQQEKELLDTKAEIEVLEKEIVEREIEKEGLSALLTEKDVRIRDLELKASKTSKQVEHLEPELQKMEEKYAREKDRLGKVFSIAEELDNDLRIAVVELNTRDSWYMDHMSLFEDLNKAIKQRYEMIEAAVESERQSQHMGRAIADRVEEMVEARAAEMTIEEATEIEATEAVTVTGIDTEGEDTGEDGDDEWTWSDSVLQGVMDKNNITDKEAFIEFAKSYDMDGNKYLKGSELGAAAVDFLNQNTSEESTSDEPESVEEVASEEAPAETWGDDVDPWADQ